MSPTRSLKDPPTCKFPSWYNFKLTGISVPSAMEIKSAMVPVFAGICSPFIKTAKNASKLKPAEAALKFAIIFVSVL